MKLSLLYKKFGKWIFTSPWKVVLCSLFIASLGAFYTSKISIKSNLADLLPSNLESVRDVNELSQQYGGIGYLMIGVETKRPQDAITFIHDLTPLLQKIPDIRYVSYRRPINFFLQYFPLYLDLSDLNEIEKRLKAKKTEMKKGASPLFEHFLSFTDDELNFDDIISKYEQKEMLEGISSEYYQNKEGTLFAILIKPSFSSKDFSRSYQLIKNVEETIQHLNPIKWGQGLEVSYGGEYQTFLDQRDHLKEEIGRISSIVLTILMLSLGIYYRRISPLLLIGSPLLIGILTTGGLVHIFLGHVNIVTGFAAMVLAGLGSDYGIYLLTRFFQEREQGNSLKISYRHTFLLTGHATRCSAVTTIIAFGALSISQFEGFSELGLIGLIGIFLNLLFMHTLLPALIVLCDRHGLFEWEKRFFPWSPQLRLKTSLLKLSLPLVLIFLALGAWSIRHASKILYVEFDLDKLETSTISSEQTDKKVSRLFNNSLRPAVIMVQGGETEEREILNTIDHIKNTSLDHPSNLRMIKGGLGLASFIPTHQEEKALIIQRIQKLLREMKLPLVGQARRLVNDFLSFPHGERIRRENLPKELTELFSHNSESTVFVYPAQPRDSTDRLNAFTNQLRSIRLNNNDKVRVASDSLITSDLLNLVEREAPWIFGLSFFLSFLYLLIEYRRFKPVFIISGMLGFSLLLFLGGMVPGGLRFNFFNLVAVPIIIGTGFDSFIHLYERYEGNKHNLLESLNQMTPSIIMSHLTTSIGFGGFIATDNGGLVSLGWMVILGMSTITAVVLLFFPSCITLYHQRKRCN